jgi:hypothetical protein
VSACFWEVPWVQGSRTRAHEAMLVRVLQTLQHAHQWLYDPANREAAVATLVAELKAETSAAHDVYAVGA